MQKDNQTAERTLLAANLLSFNIVKNGTGERT